jgi:hypothetical protein
MERRARAIWKWLWEPPTNGAAAVVLVAVIVVIVVQLIAKHGEADATTLGLVALASAFAFATFAPRQTSRVVTRITNFKVAGIEVGLATITNAERVSPPGTEDDDDKIKVSRNSEGYEETVGEMKSKLRFVRLILDLEDLVSVEDNYFEIVWRLRADDLLTDDEVRFVLDLISARDFALTGLPDDARDEFLDAAWAFAVRFGARIWDRYTRTELRSAGWFISDFKQHGNHRPDFLAYRDGRWAAIAARVGGDPGVQYYGTSRSRLAGLKPPMGLAGRCIVIPRRRLATVINKNGTGGEKGVKILKFQGSLRENPQRAFQDDPCIEDARLTKDEG